MTDVTDTQRILDIAVNSMDFIPAMATDRLRSLYMELEDLIEEKVDRELLISYISSNFATNTHLSVTILRGESSETIIGITEEIRGQIKDELDKRKASRSL